jgi:hypothetical protein
LDNFDLKNLIHHRGHREKNSLPACWPRHCGAKK